MGQDTVGSYTGFRTVAREAIDGVQRVLLVRLDEVLISVSKGSVDFVQLPFK